MGLFLRERQDAPYGFVLPPSAYGVYGKEYRVVGPRLDLKIAHILPGVVRLLHEDRDILPLRTKDRRPTLALWAMTWQHNRRGLGMQGACETATDDAAIDVREKEFLVATEGAADVLS